MFSSTAAIYSQRGYPGTVSDFGTVESNGGRGGDSVGIYLASGGTVTTGSGAVISGYGGGVQSDAGITLYNAAGATISSGGSLYNHGPGLKYAGVYNRGGSASVGNAGTITSALNGVVLSGTYATISNTGAGLIEGAKYGVQLLGTDATLVNSGTIDAAPTDPNITFGNAAVLWFGGYVSNSSGGLIYGSYTGVKGRYAAITLVNDGTISGTDLGAFLYGGIVSNAAGAEISGYNGIEISTTGTVTNAGAIGGGTGSVASGIFIGAGGNVTNTASGTISAATAVLIEGGGTVVNKGVIRGMTQSHYDVGVNLSGGTVTNLAGGTVSGYGGIYIYGAGNGGSGGTVIDAGLISATGGDAVRFGAGSDSRLVLDPGARLVGAVDGGNTLGASAITTLELRSGDDEGKLDGLGSTVTNFASIVFDTDAKWDVDGNTTGLAGTISGFDQGSTIDVTDFAATSHTFANSTLMLTDASGTFDLNLVGTFTTSEFVVKPDGATGTDVSLIPCFCAGTRIAVPDGEIPVERLAVGDVVRTLSGGARPIIWIGFGRTLITSRNRAGATPIIVRAGALGEGAPRRDLRLTRGHSLFLDDALIPVEFLINGRSILWDERAQVVEYFHLELDRHDILIADGAPAESYRDDGTGVRFQNPRPSEAPVLPPCAPILIGGPKLARLWRRLFRRAPGDPVRLTDGPDLHLLTDGERVEPQAIERGAMYSFRLAKPSANLRLRSRAVVPAMAGVSPDQRRLGVAIRRIVLTARGLVREIAFDDPRLSHGFHHAEPLEGHRWTDGNAALPPALLEGMSGPFTVAIHLGAALRYPVPTEARRHAA